MYCLEKLQRELAYFFDMDLRELPRVQDLLAAKGYTQVQKGDEIIKLEPSAQPPKTTPYTDTQGHTHQIPEPIAQKWLKTFGLKDLQEPYTPKFSEQVAQALEPILQGEQITLSANSLVKLLSRDRTEFLPYIKDTLEHSDIIIKDKENALIFAKDIGQESYFTSVSKNNQGEWIIATNSYKTINQLKNRVDESGEVLYISKEAPNILAETFTTKAFSNELAENIIPQSTQEKPKWSRADSKKWKLAKLEQTKAAATKLYEQLQPIYNQARPLLIKAKELKSPAKAQELKDKAWELIEQESKPFIKELEQHALEIDRTAFILYPETASIKIQPKSNFDLEWKNKKRAQQGLKGAAKYRAQALQRLSEKDYMTPFEQATKASNPLTSLHALKFEILKDLHKAKVYINQQGYDKDLHKTYLDYVNRASSELDSIQQSIRELKNAIVPKPQRVQEVRSKVQDFIKWRDEVRFDTDYLLALESDGVAHALEYLEAKLQAATLPQQANFINQLKEQIKEHFPTPPSPTPPKPTPPEPSLRADEVGAAIHTDTPKVDSSGITSTISKDSSDYTKLTSLKQELESLKARKAELKGKKGAASEKYEVDSNIQKKGFEISKLQSDIQRREKAFLHDFFKPKINTQEMKQTARETYDISLADAKAALRNSQNYPDSYKSKQKYIDDDMKNIENIKKKGVEYYYDMHIGYLIDNIYFLRTSSGNELDKNKRANIEKMLNIKPIAEFGTNYAEFYRDGVGAIEKLLNEKQGQVAGAFYREELGEIDLVWGDSKKGLAHIIERRKQDFIEKGFSEAEAEEKTLEFVKSLPDVIENGSIDKRIARAFLETQDSKVVIALDFNDKDNKWILTAYNKDDALNPAYSHQVKHNTNTSSETRISGDSDIIPQSTATLSKQAQEYAHQILQGLRKTAQTPLNKLADEVRSTDRKFMLREARYIKQSAQEFADSFANLRWQDLSWAIRYAKVPYNEAMFKELKAAIESKEFARFIESSYPPKPTQKSLFDEVDSSEIIFTDKKGKEHTLTQEVQEQWLETFNLKSLDEAYTPQLPQDLQEAIGKEIRLTKGSLYKIVEKGREQYIPQIKETLEKPQIVLQDESEFIFAKQIKDDLYLTSIGKDFDTHITIISNSPKTDKTIQNKLKNGKVIYEAKNAEALPTSGAFTETNQVPISKGIIPQTQMPKDNSDPVKTFEYFRDDFIKEYPKALEFYSGQIPLVSELSYRVEKSVLNEIETIKEAMNNTAKDKFKELLKNIGLKQNEIAQVLDTTIRSDIDYTLDRVKDYLDYVATHLNNFPPEHKPIAQEILAHSQNILNIFESKNPQIEQLQKKRELITSFHNNAKTSNTKEQDLLKGLIDKLYKPQSKQTPPEPSLRADEVGAAIHTDTPKLDSTLATPKQKTIEKVDTYASTPEFQTLSKDKQEAILSLKTIEPSPMPQEIAQENLENLLKHFNSKQDRAQREFYAKLFNDTKENPHITLEVKRDNEIRQEYIKAYQHKDTHDLYYIAITQENNIIKVTGYPITKIKDVINQIKNAEKVVWRHQGDQTHTALDIKKSPSLESAENIIPQPTSFDALPTPAQNLIKNFLYQIRRLEQAPSFREHDKIIAAIKKSNDTQMLATLLKIFDERYPSAKDHYLLSGLRESIQNTQTKLSNPHIAKVLQTFTEKHPNPRTQAQAVKELYHHYGTPELKGLFDKVLSAAGDVKFSIRQSYANANGKYSADKHLIILNRRFALDSEPQRLAQTLLHELIHATIARAQYHLLSPKNFPELAHKLTPAQKAAVKEIDDLYILAFKTHQAQKRAKTLGDDELEFYGFTNSKEFVAELANPKFRSYLEKQNIFKRVLEAIVKFFTGGGGEQTSILKALQESYEKYLDSFGQESGEFFTPTKASQVQKRDDLTLFDRADSSEPSFTYTTGEAKGIAELRKDLKQALEPYKSTPITNKETGLQGVVTTDEINKIASKKAVDKSVANGFSRDEHFAAAQDLKNLFENSKLKESHADNKHRENIKVHRFIKDLHINDKPAQAKITLFEKIEGKNRIYTLELESLNKPDSLSASVHNTESAAKAQSVATAHPETTTIAKTDEQSIAQKLQTLKTKEYKLSKQIDEYKHKHNIPQFTGFGKSVIQIDDPYYQSLQAEYRDLTKQIQTLQLQLARQVTPQSQPSKLESTKVSASPNPYPDFETTPQSWVDIEKVKGQDYIESLKQWHSHSHKSSKNTDGSPKVFYHGTRSDKFEVFEVGQSESGREGIYFSTSPNIAKDYDVWDQGVYEVFLHYKNPLEIDFKGAPYNSAQGREILKTIPQKLSKDHDALIYKNIRDDNQRGAGELADTIVVFEPNQIKHIENRGIESEQGRKYFNESSPNIFQSSPHASAGLLGGSAAGIEQDESGNITFDPAKFALGLLGGTAGSKAVASGYKYAIMRRMEAKKRDKRLYNVFKAIDSSAKYGSKMNLIGKENLNADTLAYALARNKRFAINKLDEKVAKELGFKYPQDVRRTIQPDEIIHTLTRHGENSDLARLSGQKPVTLDEIAKYQDYADNAQVKQESKDKSNNRVLISVGQLDNGFLVVIEQIRKGQNELGYKNMYFENGILNDETLTRIFKK